MKGYRNFLTWFGVAAGFWLAFPACGKPSPGKSAITIVKDIPSSNGGEAHHAQSYV